METRRVNDLTTALTRSGMWARVLVSCCGEHREGIIARIDETRLSFSSNCRGFDGANHIGGNDDWGFVSREFRFGWVIMASRCSNLSLWNIMTKYAFDTALDFDFVGLIREDGSIIHYNGLRTVERDEMTFIMDKYTSTNMYNGIHAYHYHHEKTPNLPRNQKRGHKIGVELEIEFNSTIEKNRWDSLAKSNWFYCERDGSLDSSRGVEIITIPMLPEDVKNSSTWEPLIGFLTNRAKSWDSPRCGLHVHIGREILGSTAEQQSETIGKLLYLYHHHVNGTQMNTRIFGREHAYNEKIGKTKEGDAVATLGSGVLKIKEVKETLKKGLIEHTKSDRYFDINLANSNTIEFRKGRGSIKTSRIIMVIEYCELMIKYAKSAKWEEISYQKFVDYITSNIKKNSPLYSFFEVGERCEL